MYSLNQSQGFFLPSFQQVSSGVFRNYRKPRTTTTAASRHDSSRASSTSTMLTPSKGSDLLTMAANELSKLSRKDFSQLLNRAILPRIEVIALEPAASHWRHPSLVSASTYFENNVNTKHEHHTGSSREAVLTVNSSFLKKSVAVAETNLSRSALSSSRFAFLHSQNYPTFVPSRGFKTRRSDSLVLPFSNRRTSQDGVDAWRGFGDNNNEDINHLKTLSSQLSGEEKEKLTAAIHGYLLAKKETSGDASGGKNFDQLLAHEQVGQRSLGKIDLASSGQAGTGKKIEIWDKIQKIASVLVIVVILFWLFPSMFNLRLLGIGRGNNEIAPEEIDVTFDDVKGCDEAKQELQEIVEFLMHPEKFSALGGKLPKGCLLVGSPGTGKTLLARAVAGQAGVPFFHAAGSEFDEVLVGQGARRVRDLFRTAKARAPCVIFIDEIDSVGSKRTSSVLHPYANQTINQLLSEMDGFLPNEGVVVLGATNRSEDLDKALLRPGRFDTQVVVPIPDMKGRREILMLYLSKIKHDNSVDVDKLAKMTVGFSGADLENMVNTSAIRAAVEGKDWVTMAEFEYSHDKHVLGTDWKSRVRDKEDLKITAYHEAGHTLVAYFTEGSKPLHKVTIVAKGMSGGHTAFIPEKDSYHETKMQFVAQMDVAMGGRAAEELIFSKDKVTGGASHDLEGATAIAELMVKKLGMSEKIGLRVIPDSQGFAGRTQELGPGTSELIDGEVSRLLNDSYKRAYTLLKSHRRELDLLAEALLNYETLDADDIKNIIEGDLKHVADKMAQSSRVQSSIKRNGGIKGQPAPASVPPKVPTKTDIQVV